MLGPYHFASKSKQELGSRIFFLYGCARSLGWLAVHVQNENLVYMLCQPQDTSSNESLLDSVKATRTKHTKQPQEQSEKNRCFFLTVAALIVTIVAVFAPCDIESLVDSEVSSLDWPAVEATQTKTNTKTNKQNTNKQPNHPREAILGELR